MGKTSRSKRRWSLVIIVLMLLLFLCGTIAVKNMDELIGNNPIETLNEERSQELVSGENYALNQEQEEQYLQMQEEQKEQIEQKQEIEDVELLQEQSTEKDKPKEEQSETVDDENPMEESKPENPPGENTPSEGTGSENSSEGDGAGGAETPGDGEIIPGDGDSGETGPPAEGPSEDEGIDKTPSISVKGLTDQMTVDGIYFEFSLRAEDYKGYLIDDYSKIFIYLGEISEATRVSGRDVVKEYRNYRVDDLTEGNNTIYIIVEDREGNRASKQYTVRANTEAQAKVIGQLHLRIDISQIGLGTLLDTYEDIYEGDGVAHVVQRALTENGLSYRHTGNASNTWYLARINKTGITDGWSISDELQERLDASGSSTTSYDADSLGEKDFYENSGWIYSMNGSSPSVGMGSKLAEEGDEILIRFVLN